MTKILSPDTRQKLLAFVLWAIEINEPENLDNITLLGAEHKPVIKLAAEQIHKCLMKHEPPIKKAKKETKKNATR